MDALWKSYPVDTESTSVEDILHIEKRLPPLVENTQEEIPSGFTQSIDFLTEAEVIERDEIIIKEANVEDNVEGIDTIG